MDTRKTVEISKDVFFSVTAQTVIEARNKAKSLSPRVDSAFEYCHIWNTAASQIHALKMLADTTDDMSLRSLLAEQYSYCLDRAERDANAAIRLRTETEIDRILEPVGRDVVLSEINRRIENMRRSQAEISEFVDSQL